MFVSLTPVAAASKSTTPKLSALQQVFQTIDADSCPTSYNFHLHTTYSDGQLRPETLMEQAITIGLKGLAITDHHSIGGYQVAKQWLDTWKSGQGDSNSAAPKLWTGIEINAGLLKVEVHILGYGFDPEHPSLERYLQSKATTGRDYLAKNVIAAIQAAGGLAVLAHPARYRATAAELIPEAARLGINGVETYYAYNNPIPWQPSPQQTAQVKKLAEHYGLLTTCGTDTHGQNILQRI